MEAQESSTARVTREVLDREEIWLPIPGHEGYEASNTMKIRSLDRRIEYVKENGKVVNQRCWGRELKQNKNNKYWRVSIGQVHRLVCLAFHGAPESPDLVARHLNDDKDDNRPENVAWGTQSQNALDSRRNKVWNNQNSVKDKCKKGHEFDMVDKNGSRRCSICIAEYKREWVNKNRKKVNEHKARWARENYRKKRDGK